MGLFDKKNCDICGGKIGLLGNKKLSDGNLCKDCAEKLSPWFSERKQSSVADIQAQLAYREQNRDAVAAFHTTRTLGVMTKVLLDEDNMKFMVTSATNLAAANPDVMDYSQITGCMLDIKENKTELYQRGPDGKNVSYNPRQYTYNYDFYMVINVNHPYFNEIRFKLNQNQITVQPTITGRVGGAVGGGFGGQAQRPGMGGQPQRPGMGGQPQRPGMGGQPQRPGMGGQPQRPGMGGQPQRPGFGGQAQRPGMGMGMGMTSSVVSSTPVDPTSNPEYVRYQQLGEEIRQALLDVHQEARDNAAAANVPPQTVNCPYCGATTTISAETSWCCEYCGAALEH